MTSSLITVGWLIGASFTWWQIMKFTARHYARTGLGWGADDSVANGLIVGFGAVIFWPLWWVAVVAWFVIRRITRGGITERLKQENRDARG